MTQFLIPLILCMTQTSRKWVSVLDVRRWFEFQKLFHRLLPLSRFVAKTLRINNVAIKSFSKNLSLGVVIKLYLLPIVYKINAHNISGVRSQVLIPTESNIRKKKSCSVIFYSQKCHFIKFFQMKLQSLIFFFINLFTHLIQPTIHEYNKTLYIEQHQRQQKGRCLITNAFVMFVNVITHLAITFTIITDHCLLRFSQMMLIAVLIVTARLTTFIE